MPDNIQQRPSILDMVAGALSGLGSGIGQATGAAGNFLSDATKTPEGRQALSVLVGALSGDPIVGGSIAKASTDQYKMDKSNEQQQKMFLQQLAATNAMQESQRNQKLKDDERKRQLNLEDEQRKRQEKLEDDLKKKNQDPTESRLNKRTESSHNILLKYENEKNPYYADETQFAKDLLVPYPIKSQKYKQVEQAQRDFINATLRRESGAAIADSEFENAQKQYFPQLGDTKEVVKQKQRNREFQFKQITETPQEFDPLGIL